MQEQMYLCTVLPGHKKDTPVVLGRTVEATAVHVWRNSEARVVFTAGTISVSIPTHSLPNNHWTFLLISPLFRITCLFESLANNRLSASGPVALRVHVVRDIFDAQLSRGLCSAEFVEWEARLNNVLSTTMYTVESTADKRKRPTWDVPRVGLDVGASTAFGPDHKFDWNALLFSSTRAPSVTREFPMSLYVSDITPRADYLIAACASPRRGRTRAGLLDTVAAPQGLLVVSAHCDMWVAAAQKASMTVFTEALELSRQDMESESFCVVVHPDSIITTLYSLVDLDDLMGDALLHRSVPFKTLGRRMFVNAVATKFPNVRTPIPLIQFGCAILDDLGRDTGSVKQLVVSDKLVHVIVDHERMRVEWPSMKDLAMVYGAELPHWALPLLHRDGQDLIHVLPTPKSVKKHVKLVGHPVRASTAEDRVSAMFRHRPVPVPIADALQRFSARPLPLTVMRELVLRSFQTWSSTLGEFLKSDREGVHQLSEHFVKSVLEQLGSDACGICFDTKAEAMALCGHVYCKDCARQHFGSAWADNQIQSCAMCRVALTSGDLFFVQPDGEAFEPVKTSKVSALDGFLCGLRNKALMQVWCEGGDVRPETRTLVITNIKDVLAIDVMKALKDCPHAVQVHIFHTPEETSAFDCFHTDFNV